MAELTLKNFWYIACFSEDLKCEKPLEREILDEWLVFFRDSSGMAIALQNNCIHRHFKLSEGKVKNGCIQCPYHGWSYDKGGVVDCIPAEGPEFKKSSGRKVQSYLVKEQDGFVYVLLQENDDYSFSPFEMPKYKATGFKTVRLFNEFENNVTNCAENYIDVPHTVFVHQGIFRKSKQQKIDIQFKRENGSVIIDYLGEDTNFGWFSKFLNPKGTPVKHRDSFHMPNITSVEYDFGNGKEFFITSQSVPVTDTLTHVYTDLTFNFGIWNCIASPFVKYQGQAVIDQDIEVLGIQNEVIEKYGRKFTNSSADLIHVMIESIIDAIEAGKDPRELKNQQKDISIWI